MTGLILSHQRCGSSALARFIREACSAQVMLEPLNTRYLKEWSPEWHKLPPQDFTEHVGRTLWPLDVAKHIYGQHDAFTERMIYAHPFVDRIVVLGRGDVEAAALSSLVASATENWNATEGNIPAIDPGAVASAASELTRKRERALVLAESTGVPVKHLWYEDVFDQPGREALLRELIAFLGLQVNGDFAGAFSRHMSAEKKINSADTYRMIENFDEMAAAFPSIFSPLRTRRFGRR